MKERIRYEKKENQLISKELVSNSGAKYIVYLNLDTMTYLIRNQTSMRKYEGGEGINNLTVLKRKVKKHLQHLGIKFEKEKRNRQFGLCPKGFSQKQHDEEKRKIKEQLINQ